MARVLGLGADLVEVERVSGLLERRPGAAERIFTEYEQMFAYRGGNRGLASQRLAARFAAKEAVMKALGVGIGAVAWKDIEVTRAESGAPGVRLSGRAAELSKEKGIQNWLLTLSHTGQTAMAVAVAE